MQIHANTGPVEVNIPQQGPQSVDTLRLTEVQDGAEEYSPLLLSTAGRLVGERERVDAALARFEIWWG